MTPLAAPVLAADEYDTTDLSADERAVLAPIIFLPGAVAVGARRM